MDVSAVRREFRPVVDPLARAAPTRREREDAAGSDDRRDDQPPPHRPRSPVPPPSRHVDPCEGVAERATSGLDNPRPRAAADVDGTVSEELWIPGWVRLAYASRARRGWFLPASTMLAGYGDEDDERK